MHTVTSNPFSHQDLNTRFALCSGTRGFRPQPGFVVKMALARKHASGLKITARSGTGGGRGRCVGWLSLTFFFYVIHRCWVLTLVSYLASGPRPGDVLYVNVCGFEGCEAPRTKTGEAVVDTVIERPSESAATT